MTAEEASVVRCALERSVFSAPRYQRAARRLRLVAGKHDRPVTSGAPQLVLKKENEAVDV
jgi:hypothetical protein